MFKDLRTSVPMIPNLVFGIQAQKPYLLGNYILKIIPNMDLPSLCTTGIYIYRVVGIQKTGVKSMGYMGLSAKTQKKGLVRYVVC